MQQQLVTLEDKYKRLMELLSRLTSIGTFMANKDEVVTVDSGGDATIEGPWSKLYDLVHTEALQLANEILVNSAH
jgi:hypothetical protein